MGVLDYVFRIKPTAGHTVPTDLVTGNAVLATNVGSTVTKVDKGGGLYAWQFLNGTVSGASPTAVAALNLNAGSDDQGATLVFRGRVVANQFGESDLVLCQFGANTSKFDGLSITRPSTSDMQCSYGGVTAPHTGAASTTLRTYVVRVTANSGGDNDPVDSWITTASRVGTAPNASGPLNVRSGQALTTLMIKPSVNGYIVEAEEIIFYRGAKTDAECAALADDLAATLGGDTTPPVITGPGGATGPTATLSIAAGGTAVHTYSANESGTWSLNGGADVGLFTINGSTGALAFQAASTAGTRVVGVRYTDTAGNATTQTLTLTVTAAATWGLTFAGNTAYRCTSFAGGGAGLVSEAGTQVVVVVQDQTTDVEVARSGTLTADPEGYLPRFVHASLAGPSAAYDVKVKPVDGRAPYTVRMFTS